jgi:DNA-binding CsgD family transcriptional regulator
MSNRAKLELILGLTKEEIEILFWVCKGLTKTEILKEISIGKKTEYSEGTYYSRMGRVYEKLEFPKNLHSKKKREKLLDEIRPVVNDNITEENIKRWDVFRRDKKDELERERAEEELRKERAETFVQDLEDQITQDLPSPQTDEENGEDEFSEEDVEEEETEETQEAEEEEEDHKKETIRIRPEDRRRGQEEQEYQ